MYPIQFSRNQFQGVKALIDFSEINVMTAAYTTKQGLTSQKTIVGAKNIYGLTLKTYSTALAKLSI